MDVRKNLGDILARVKLRGEEFILEKGGKPTAVILPYHKFALSQEKSWNRIFQLITEKDPKVDLNDNEVSDFVEEVISEVRSLKVHKKKK